MSSTSTSFKSLDREYLASLPTEILIKILSEVPIASFLDILHTSSRLRAILKANAAVICNLAVKSRFRKQAKYLNTKLVSSWSVPSHLQIFEEKLLYKRLYNRTLSSNLGTGKNSYVKHYSLLGPASNVISTEHFPISLFAPGPQFLYFLEYPNLMTLDVDDGEDWYPWLHYYIDSDHFKEFMDGANDRWLDVGDEEVERPARNFMKFPRELVWYYGVDGLKDIEL